MKRIYSKQEILEDLEWAYQRLDHLLTIYEEGCMGLSTFSGPGETMVTVRGKLPYFRTKYGFKATWPSGRFRKAAKRKKKAKR